MSMLKRYFSKNMNRVKYYSIHVFMIALIIIAFSFGNVLSGVSLLVLYLAFLLSVIL